MTDFIILSLLGGIVLSITMSLMGNFVLWNRMSYLGDSIAHNSLLGLVAALFIPVSPDLLVLAVCFISAFTLVFLNKKFNIPIAPLLILSTQLALALGFAILSLFNPSTMINNYFFGNILGLKIYDILAMLILLTAILAYLYFYYERILLLSINEEIYNAENNNAFYLTLAFTFILSATIVYAIKFAGVLLAPSLLILPALLATNLSHSAIKTILISILFGVFATTSGILLSIKVDIPTGPLITIILAILLFLKLGIIKLRKIINSKI